VTRFVIVPQWQGSPSARAMGLVDGAEAIAGDLPSSAVVRVAVPLEAGDALGSRVHRLSALARVRGALDELLGGIDERVLLVGGDCSVSVAGIAHAAARCERLAVVWADAHPDLHTPDSSPSHAFSGMTLRAVLGDGPEPLRIRPGAVRPGDVVLVGVRAWDDAEAGYADGAGMRTVPAAALPDPDAIADAVAATGADAVYVHVDVDVLDPGCMPGVKAAEPFGADLSALVAGLKRLRERVPLAGATIAEYVPADAGPDPADLGTILRLVGALA